MNLESLNKWLTLAANMGVLVGIFVVAIELQQTQVQLQAEAGARRADMSRQQNRDAVQYNMGEIAEKINTGQGLSNAESYRSRMFMNNILRYFEALHYQYQLGVLDDEIWSSNLNTIRLMCRGQNETYSYLFPSGLTNESYRDSFKELINPPCPE